MEKHKIPFHLYLGAEFIDSLQVDWRRPVNSENSPIYEITLHGLEDLVERPNYKRLILRPLSDMTKKETKKYNSLKSPALYDTPESFEWLLQNSFDIGLIPEEHIVYKKRNKIIPI